MTERETDVGLAKEVLKSTTELKKKLVHQESSLHLILLVKIHSESQHLALHTGLSCHEMQ